jgi:Flp pilus assembly protein TadG
MQNAPSCRSSGGRDEAGSTLVEFSFVFVLFVFICYALVAFGMALSMKHTLTQASAEGARAAIPAYQSCRSEPDPDQCVRDAVQARTRQVISDAQGSARAAAAVITPVLGRCTGGSSSAECVTVTVDYPYGAEPIVPSAPGLGVVMPDHMRSTSVVQVTN